MRIVATPPLTEPSSRTGSARTPRRVFVVAAEIPGLLVGACRGEPVALRRVLGARRSGRIGILLCGAALGAAAAPRDWWIVVAAHASLSALTWSLFARSVGLRPRAQQRLLLWLLIPALLCAAALRLIFGASWLWPVAAVAAAHAVLVRHLQRSQPFGPTATQAPSEAVRAPLPPA